MSDEWVARLRAIGWNIEKSKTNLSFSIDVNSRYSWLPSNVIQFLEQFSVFATNDDTAWLLTISDFTETSDSAFRWNQWELDSIEAARDDVEWTQDIRAFWDRHFPILMSVRNGYKYLALRKEDGRIVGGAEPEFEETEVVAESIDELLQSLANGLADEYL